MSAPIITFSNNAGPVFHFINKNEKTKMADKYLQLVSEVIDYLADEGFIVKDGNKVKESIRFEEATFVVDKVKRAKKDKVVKIPIPFDSKNVKFDDECKLIGCNCLMKNHGLYTQCNRIPKNGSETCSTCKALNIKNDGKPIYGTVQERLKSDYHNSDLVHYTVVMKKLKIEWDQVVEEAEKLGLVLDTSHSIEPENSVNTVAKKGRPKKVTVPNVETVSNVDTVYPIATVVATQKENKTTNKKENTNNKKEKKTKKVEVVQPIIEEFDSDNDIDIDSDIDNDIDSDNDIDIDSDIDNVEEEEEEEEEEVVVETFVYGKKQLLKDLNNNIYDLNNVKIGVYDPVTKKVKYDLKKTK
jgi:hypothetical protein